LHRSIPPLNPIASGLARTAAGAFISFTTAFGRHFFTSAQALSDSGRKAWSAGVVPTSL